jgi:hypothetical protein
MTILILVYLTYFLLAGVAGLVLYLLVARICYERLLQYLAMHSGPGLMHELLMSAVVIVVCSALTQYCFLRAASLLQAVL